MLLDPAYDVVQFLCRTNYEAVMDAENCNVLPRKVIQQHVGNFVALKPARTIEQRV